MGVPHEDQIDPRNCPGDGERGVFIRHLPGRRLPGRKVLLQPHVQGEHDDVDPFARAQHLHPAPRRRDRLGEGQPGVVRFIFPIWNARCGDPKNTDSYALHLLDDVRGVERIRGARPINVARDPGKHGLAARLFQHGETEIVLVVAQSEAGKAEGVHGQHHRIDRFIADSVVIVGEGRALDRVSAVDQDQVRHVLARRPDQRGHPRQPVGRGLIRAVIDGVDVAVQIGGGKHRDMSPLGGEARGPAEHQKGRNNDAAKKPVHGAALKQVPVPTRAEGGNGPWFTGLAAHRLQSGRRRPLPAHLRPPRCSPRAGV